MDSNSFTTDLNEDKTLFTMDDVLDEGNLELDTTIDESYHKDNQVTGELTSKAIKSDDVKVPAYLWDD